MYQYIDDKNYKHLIGIIIGGSEKEESIHGLVPCWRAYVIAALF